MVPILRVMITGKVRVTCPTCGPVHVRGADITVLSRPEILQNVYRFECPVCSASIVREAGPNLVTLLLRAGARAKRWPQLLPLDDRADPIRPPFTKADLIAYRQKLECLPTAGSDPSG